MAGGFAKDGAVQDQIDASVKDAIKRARNDMPQGEFWHQSRAMNRQPAMAAHSLSYAGYLIDIRNHPPASPACL